MKRNRLVLYPKDVQLVTGRGLRYAQRILRIIRKRYGKKQDQFVTVEEFCEFSGITRQQLDAYLQ